MDQMMSGLILIKFAGAILGVLFAPDKGSGPGKRSMKRMLLTSPLKIKSEQVEADAYDLI